jgi:hypothetical protein
MYKPTSFFSAAAPHEEHLITLLLSQWNPNNQRSDKGAPTTKKDFVSQATRITAAPPAKKRSPIKGDLCCIRMVR